MYKKGYTKGGENMEEYNKGSLVIAFAIGMSFCLSLTILFSPGVKPAYSADEQVLKPRVPADKLAEVKGLANKMSANSEAKEEGREIFSGRGFCFSCHGKEGKGDGPAGASFKPGPRSFTDVDWQKARTDGEIFWSITNGTEYGMLAFENMLTDEERWELVSYIRDLGNPAVASK